MQGKGIIKFFLVLMALVCIWQFLLTLPTKTVERNAEEYALSGGNNVGSSLYNDRLGEYLDSMSNEVVQPTPFKDYTYQDLKNSQLAYGLDLVGGMSVVMQVDLSEFLLSLSQDSNDEAFDKALAAAKEAQRNTQEDFVTLFSNAYEEANPSGSLAQYFLNTGDDDNQLNVKSTNAETVRWIRSEADGTVKRTYELLRERIDKLGVVQPNVSLDAARDMIIVELPGIKNAKRAREFLTATATLEFWQTYRNNDNNSKIIQAFVDIDTKLAKVLGGDEATTTDEPEFIDRVDTTFAVDTDGNFIEPKTVERLDTIQIPNPAVAQEAGPLFKKFQPNTSLSQDGSGSPILGFAKGNDRAEIDKLFARAEVQNILPRDLTLMWGYKPEILKDADGEEIEQYYLYGIKKRKGDVAPLDGSVITSAGTQNDQGSIEVTLGMNQEGAGTWFKMTKQASENGKREVGIVLDNQVVSSPSVRNGPISGGRTSISGNFSVQEANDLARVLEIGKLPAKPIIIQEAIVGPTLGADNTSRSLTALAGGTLLVMLFMMAYYGGAGIVSILALLLNLAFIFGALASLKAVLTLPGIAGIVLTIGMAVDANVIIYERIREELRSGKSTLLAIKDGFSHSYSAIIDANVTTFLVAMVLAYFGLGPIKGFAVVLMVGVVCSIFTAVLVGRLLIDWWTTGRGNDLSFWTGPSKNAFANVKVDWLGKRKAAYGVSMAIILIGIGSMVMRGFELGVDFKGGYAYNVQFAEDVNVDIATLKTNLEEAFVGAPAPVVKAVSTTNTFAVTTSYLINDNSAEAADKVMAALYSGVNKTAGGTVKSIEDFQSDRLGITHVISSSKVGPTIADDIRNTAFYAGIFALLVIFLYITLRFTRWEYSAGAVAALFHDTLIVLSIFSIFHGILPFPMEIDQAFIAAILTVIGYSINDTVVVFDRIREYMNEYTGWSKEEIVNKAVDSTVSRTVITSLTTLFVIFMLFIFGRGSIQGFAFALLIGVIVGTYSSIFVATPVFYDLSGDLKPKSKKKKVQKGFRRPEPTTTGK